MKTEFRLPHPPIAAPRDARAEIVRGDIPYAPLQLPHLLARRIEIAPRPRVEVGRFRWKRDDESVN
jgi:hypothetical protein